MKDRQHLVERSILVEISAQIVHVLLFLQSSASSARLIPCRKARTDGVSRAFKQSSDEVQAKFKRAGLAHIDKLAFFARNLRIETESREP